MADNPFLKYLKDAPAGGADPALGSPSTNPFLKYAGQSTDYRRMSLEQLDAEYKKQRAEMASPEQLSAIADAYAAKEWEAEQTPLGHAKGFVSQGLPSAAHLMARGVPVIGGALDEIRAGAISAAGGDYDQALEFQRARDRRIDKTMPIISGAGQIAGGLFSGGLALKALGWGGNVAQQ